MYANIKRVKVTIHSTITVTMVYYILRVWNGELYRTVLSQTHGMVLSQIYFIWYGTKILKFKHLII